MEENPSGKGGRKEIPVALWGIQCYSYYPWPARMTGGSVSEGGLFYSFPHSNTGEQK